VWGARHLTSPQPARKCTPTSPGGEVWRGALRYSEPMVERVLATPGALELIERLKQKHGPLMFHQSGGCCDGSAPMCYPKGEFRVGGNDVKLGQIGGCDVYMDADQFDYWKHTQLIIDVVPGRGHGFTLEAPEGLRFLTRSRVFSDEEADALARS